VRSKANSDLKVGLTVLIGIVLLLFGIGLAKGWHIGSSSHSLHAHFTTAGGIEEGDPVYIRGIKHGTVAKINSSAGSDVDLVLDIDDKTGKLHKDATATILMLELMGGKKVEIDEGINGTFDEAKDTIMGVFPGDLSTLVAALNTVSGSFPSLTRNVDSVLLAINGFFDRGKFKDKAYATLDRAELALKDLQSVLSENRGALKRTIDQADVLTREMNNTVTSLRPGAQEIIDSTRAFLRGARTTLRGADSLLGSLNDMMYGSKDKRSLLFRLTNDTELAARFDSLLINGHKLIEQIRFQGVDANIRFFNSSKPVK
jgi:ABC-type transporter Mla subunit MlaD